MPLPRFDITCTHVENIATDIYEIRFAKPDDFTFTAGQYVMWDVPLLNDPEDIQPRAYSIASTPEEDDLLFVIKYMEGGRASEWIQQQLKIGDTVHIQGPLGVFTLDETANKDLLFVCTSTGNAPLRSIIKHALEHNVTNRIDLLFGVLSEDRLFWTEEFEELSHQYANFFWHPTVSDPSENWKGHTGWVQSLFDKVVRDINQRSVYVCGNPNMTKDVKTICMEQYGMEKGDVHIEGYI